MSCSRPNHVGQVVMATPAISDGTIIIRGLEGRLRDQSQKP